MLKKLSVFVAICCLATACDDSDSNDSPKAEPVCGNGEVDFVVNVKPNPGPETRCGDGKHEAGEVCDPAYNGQYSDRKGNLKTCIATDKGKCVFETDTGKDKDFNCGNGTLDPGEGCDDGNTANGDGCSSSCTTETDTCIIKNGTVGQVLLVVDGDTLKIRITDDGNAGKKASKALTVRMHGIDSPECLKAQTVSSVDPSYKANSCDKGQSKDYSNKEKNERGGYEAGEFVKSLVFSEENEGKIFVECETRSATDATCLTDATNNRFLAYIKVRSGGKIVDLAEETVRAGYAMAYTDFTSQRTAVYCAAEKEAIAAKTGVWKYGDTFKKVVEDNFNADKNRWLLDAKHCK